MSEQSVRDWLAEYAPDLRLIVVTDSTATVADASMALGVEPGRIAKTLAVRAGEQTFLLVTRGDARLDNRKCKDALGARPRMLGPEETLALTGHPVGGFARSGWRPRCRSISTIHCAISIWSIRRAGRSTRRSKSRWAACSSWSASVGST